MLGHTERQLEAPVLQTVCYLVNWLVKLDRYVQSGLFKEALILGDPQRHVEVIARDSANLNFLHISPSLQTNKIQI